MQGGPRGDVLERAATWSVLLPIIPIVVVTIRLVASDWEPLGDAAYFAVRSRDVLTDHHPLLGAWSSGSTRLEESVNNLGPLQLDLLAPFTKIGGPAGLAVGIGVLNAAAIVGVWATARRLVGPLGVIAIVATTASLGWSIGSRGLVEGRQQWALMLPMWCLLVLVWAVASGRSFALVPLVFVASLVAQTHLTYALSALACCIAGVIGFVVVRVTTRGARPPDDPVRRHLLLAVAVGLACWAQPLWDQFFDSGNLLKVVRSDATGVGAETGVRLVAEVATVPPFWFGDSIERFDAGGFLSVSAAVWRFGIIVAVTACVATVMIVRRTGSLPVRAAAVLSPVLLLVAWACAASIPVTSFGIAPQNYRWLWPVAAFVTFSLAASLWSLVRSRVATWRSPLALAVALAAALAVVPNLATTYRDPELLEEDRAAGVAGELRAELGANLEALELQSPVVFVRRYEETFSPFGYSIMMALQDADVEFVFGDSIDSQRFRDRRIGRSMARPLPRLRVVTGSNIEEIGTTVLVGEPLVLVAEATSVTAEEDARRQVLDRRMVEALRTGAIEVDESRARYYFGDRIEPLLAIVEGTTSDSLWKITRMVDSLAGLDALSGDPAILGDIDEWRALHRSNELEHVAVYVDSD